MKNSILRLCHAAILAAAVGMGSAAAIAQTVNPPSTDPGPSQDEQRPSAQDEQKPPESVNRVQTLQGLVRNLELKRAEIEELRQKIRDTTDKARLTDLNKTLTERQDEVIKLERDFESVATGIDVAAFGEKAADSFQIGREIESLLQPLIQQLKEVTKEPRQIEQLRNDVESRRQRAKSATEAIVNIQRLLMQSPPESLARELNSLQQRWQNLRQEAESQAQVSQLQLDGTLRQRKSLVASSQDLIGGFFRNRGLNLLLAALAFFGVLLGMRLFARPIRRLSTRRRKDKKSGASFYARLLNVVFFGFMVVIATAAALMVLYTAGDWLLLGLALLFLLGLAWASKNTIPKFVDQIRLLLNLGAVREREKVIFNGIAWRVESLNIYTRLVNPELSGGLLRLPIRHLVGLHSRPVSDREVWFPCREGDWVLVGDGVRGRVVSQTPDMVQLVQLGGARVTYQTETFLGLNPTNLSTNFRVRVAFGVDYQHQGIVTTLIPIKMREKLLNELTEMVGEEHVVNINVEFKAAGASSLDLEVLADFDGAVASRFDTLNRAVQRILVDACNENGWVIPFTQVTLHQAKAG